MDAVRSGNELIDVVVRIPRLEIEKALLVTPASDADVGHRRLIDAKAVLAGRRRRAACFKGARFSDPSWDMILELYVATCEQRHIAVSHLCRLSGSSTTTALRHLEHLEALRYIERIADPADGRRLIVATLNPLMEASERWLDLQSAEYQIQNLSAT